MENSTNQTPANKWLSVPTIATITRLLCRELTLQNEYLRQENKILKPKIKKRFVFTDDEWQTLIASALVIDRNVARQLRNVDQPESFDLQQNLQQT